MRDTNNIIISCSIDIDMLVRQISILLTILVWLLSVESHKTNYLMSSYIELYGKKVNRVITTYSIGNLGLGQAQ